ncbi:thioredoxin-like protein [Atractiella rhizophila]|nr:thioredoxin-like protein [Atractiella rhizophila]
MSQAFIRKPAPAFKGEAVEDGVFKDIALSDYAGKWLVLFFYPRDFTFVCPTEILAFNKALPEFAAINASLVACSTDSVYCHLAFSNLPQSEGGLGPNLKMTLLSDENHKISKAYGVLLEEEGIALRGLFIIDPKGILRQMTINDTQVGRSVPETIRLVQAFQYTDEHGEGCPAGWTPGADGIKQDPIGAKDYFSTAAESSSAERAKGPLVNGLKHALENGSSNEAAKKARTS